MAACSQSFPYIDSVLWNWFLSFMSSYWHSVFAFSRIYLVLSLSVEFSFSLDHFLKHIGNVLFYLAVFWFFAFCLSFSFYQVALVFNQFGLRIIPLSLCCNWANSLRYHATTQPSHTNTPMSCFVHWRSFYT